jgi:hypothetical protein
MEKIPEMKGPYSSRKFVLTIISICLITAVAMSSAWISVIPTILPAFIGGILGTLSLYLGGNVANKFVVGKQMVEISKTKDGEI